jgi:hypothetical protein
MTARPRGEAGGWRRLRRTCRDRPHRAAGPVPETPFPRTHHRSRIRTASSAGRRTERQRRGRRAISQADDPARRRAPEPNRFRRPRSDVRRIGRPVARRRTPHRRPSPQPATETGTSGPAALDPSHRRRRPVPPFLPTGVGRRCWTSENPGHNCLTGTRAAAVDAPSVLRPVRPGVLIVPHPVPWTRGCTMRHA